MTMLRDFQSSACYSCTYCKEYKCNTVDNLDIRKNGVIKVWCYAANDVVPLMMIPKSETCFIKEAAEQ